MKWFFSIVVLAPSIAWGSCLAGASEQRSGTFKVKKVEKARGLCGSKIAERPSKDLSYWTLPGCVATVTDQKKEFRVYSQSNLCKAKRGSKVNVSMTSTCYELLIELSCEKDEMETFVKGASRHRLAQEATAEFFENERSEKPKIKAIATPPQ